MCTYHSYGGRVLQQKQLQFLNENQLAIFVDISILSRVTCRFDNTFFLLESRHQDRNIVDLRTCHHVFLIATNFHSTSKYITDKILNDFVIN